MPDSPQVPATGIGPLALVEYPHPALLRPAKPLVRIDEAVCDAVSQMFDIMYEAEGIGLAANQVALPYRLFIVNTTGRRGDGEELVFINPVLSRPRGTAIQEEGCLSLPGLRMDVRRPEKIVVEAWSLDGQPIRLDLGGLLSRVVQHEFDHLEGKLFTDRLPEAAAIEARRTLESFREVFVGQQSRGELPAHDEIVARLSIGSKRTAARHDPRSCQRTEAFFADRRDGHGPVRRADVPRDSHVAASGDRRCHPAGRIARAAGGRPQTRCATRPLRPACRFLIPSGSTIPIRSLRSGRFPRPARGLRLWPDPLACRPRRRPVWRHQPARLAVAPAPGRGTGAVGDPLRRSLDRRGVIHMTPAARRGERDRGEGNADQRL